MRDACLNRTVTEDTEAERQNLYQPQGCQFWLQPYPHLEASPTLPGPERQGQKLNLSPVSFFFGHVACGILSPRPVIKAHEMEAWSLNHWTSREVPFSCLQLFSLVSHRGPHFFMQPHLCSGFPISCLNHSSSFRLIQISLSSLNQCQTSAPLSEAHAIPSLNPSVVLLQGS